jgi:hypothetical protein
LSFLGISLLDEAISTFVIRNNKLSNKIYHGYDSSEIDAFLEENVYYAMLLVTLYEVKGDESSLEKAITIMRETWEIFYNKDTQLLQKNKIKENDLFVSPIELKESNIPKGNRVYLNLCNKIYTITKDKFGFDKVEVLKKSFHQGLNSFFSQRFSFIKTLELGENSISFTFFGNKDSIKDIKLNLQKEYLGRATFVYKNNKEKEASGVICKNQTGSEKLKNLKEVKNYLGKKN